MKRRRFMAGAACALGAPAAKLAQAAAASGFPGAGLKFVTSTTPGAGMDLTSRLVAEKLTAMYGKPVVVENRPGGNGVLAVSYFKTVDDPNTLLVTDVGVASVNPSLMRNLPYEPTRDFVPVTDFFRTDFVFLCPPGRFASLEDFIAKVKAEPRKYNFGASSGGSGQRLSVELFLSQTNLQMTFIPYKGNSEALAALLGGQLDLVSIGLPPIKGHIEAGRLQPLAVTGAARSPMLPDVRTVAEVAKLPGYSEGSWVGLFAKPAMPAEHVARLQSDIAKAMAMPDVQAFFRANDYRGGGHASAALAQLMASDREKYAQVIKAANITAN